MQKITGIIFCLLFCYILNAQLPGQYTFTNYNSESGLLSNQVNTVVQDEEGFIWIGTTDGLQRFDGIRYKSFRHRENNPSSIPSNPVWQVLPGKNNQLWLLMADGSVGIFNTRSFVYKEVPVIFKNPVSPNTFVKRLITDEQGNVFYLVGGNEVITWNESAGNFSYTNNFFKQLPGWNIVDFIQQPGSTKYLLSIDKTGIAVYNKATAQLSYRGNNKERETLVEAFDPGENYDRLFIDRQHRLWSASPGNYSSINCYDLIANRPIIQKEERSAALKTTHEIKGFFQQGDGSVWVNGLQVFAKYIEAEKRFQLVDNGYRHDHSIEYEMVHCLYEDREKNIWIGTDNNGLYRFNPTTSFFANIRHLNNETGKAGDARLLSFAATHWGTLLAGTGGNGLYQYDKNFNQIPLEIKWPGTKPPAFIWSLCASSDSNTIWLSSQEGMYAINQATRSATYYNPPVLGNSSIRQIAEDKNGNLWLGTADKGVFKYTAGNHPINDGIASFISIPPVQVNKITIDKVGLIWIATPENGVYVIDPVADKVTMHLTNSGGPEKLPERGVSSILDYDDSTVVITTATRVVLYNRKLNKCEAIGKSDMISGFITAAEKDNQGYLWITSTSGLYRINIFKNIFVKFNRSDGILNEHFIQSSSTVLSNGMMLFGTTNNFVGFDPAIIKAPAIFPRIRITDFKVMNNSLNVDSLLRLKEVELDHSENSIIIEFSPLLYNVASQVKFKLEPIDKDWKVADRNFQAIYNYLPPGTYSLWLQTRDEEGNESAPVKQLQLRVYPPFWKSWWFFSLMALAIGALLFWLDKERMKRKEAMHKMRADIALNLHEEVNTALSNINILSEMSKLKAGKEPEKSIEFIDQIHTRSQNMMIAMDDMLWSIDPENDSMAKATERLSEHIDGLSNHYNTSISLVVDKNVDNLTLNMKLKKDIFWFFKTGASNIIKSGAKECHIHISYTKPNLIYKVSFNNSELNTQQLSNLLQRQELADKLKEVKGNIDKQVYGLQTIIQLTIPVH